jgi:probable O-glycosylation ligase (exosortase A-associated)
VIALALWLWTAAFNINQLVYGVAASISYNKLFAGITMLSFFISKENKAIKIESVTIIIILFFTIATISNVFAIGDVSKAWERWVLYFKIILFYFFAIAVIKEKKHFDLLIWILIISIGALAATEGLKFVISLGKHRIGSLRGIAGDNNFFGVMVVTIMPLTIYIITQTKHKVLKIGLIGVLFLMAAGLFSTYSRGATVALMIQIIFFVKNSEKKFFMIVLLVLGYAFSDLMPEEWFSRMDTIENADKDASFMGRVVAWKLSTLIAMDNFFGGGFKALENFSIWQLYTLEFNKLDFIQTPYPDEYKYHASHSSYFQVLGNHGFLGLFVFLLLLITVFLKLSKIQKIAINNNLSGWIINLSKTLKLSLISYAVSGAFVNVAYFDFVYLLFALTVALEQISTQELSTYN